MFFLSLSCDFDKVYPLFTPKQYIIPFQIVRPTRSNPISEVLLKNLDGTTYADTTYSMIATGLSVVRYESLGYDVIVYTGGSEISVDMPTGRYYLEITDGNISSKRV